MQFVPTAFAIATGAVVLLLLAGPVSAGRDEDVTARAMAALTAVGMPDSANIVVVSFNGEVELSGTVRSEHARAEVARVVGAVPGVTAVRNDLAVRPPSGDRDGDAVIAERVRATLASEMPGMRDVAVSVFNGVVELTGVVARDDIRATAARVAGEVRGASAIRNALLVRQP
jgi:osmotically-inducible protein OsmY